MMLPRLGCLHGRFSSHLNSVAKSVELERMYANARRVSQAINWDSLLVSLWFLREPTLGLIAGS